MMKKHFLFLAILVVAVACRKEGKVYKQLDGSWEVTEVDFLRGEELFLPGDNLTFDECKNKVAPCDLLIRYADAEEATDTGSFFVDWGGQEITIWVPGNEALIWIIKESGNSTLELERENSLRTDYIQLEAEK